MEIGYCLYNQKKDIWKAKLLSWGNGPIYQLLWNDLEDCGITKWDFIVYILHLYRYKEAKKLVKTRIESTLKPKKKVLRMKVRDKDISHFTAHVLQKNTRV